MDELRSQIEGAAQALLVLAAMRCLLTRRVQPGSGRPWILLTVAFALTFGRRALRGLIGPYALGPEWQLAESCLLLAISSFQFFAFGELKRRAIVDVTEKAGLHAKIRELADEVRCWERDEGGDDGTGTDKGSAALEALAASCGARPGPPG